MVLQMSKEDSKDNDLLQPFSTRDYTSKNEYNRIQSLFQKDENQDLEHAGIFEQRVAKQRPHTSKRPHRPAIKSMSSIPNWQTLRQVGPASTKHSYGRKASQFKPHSNIFMDETTAGEEVGLEGDTKNLTSRIYEISHEPDKLISVAERSVLSQNFVNGTEESEESIVGIEKKVNQKPLAYGEFKEAVKRKS